MTERSDGEVTRRDLLRWGLGTAALNAGLPGAWARSGSRRGAEQTVIGLNQGWSLRAADAPESSAASVTLPHTPVRLSWQDWDPDSWQRVWIYRRSFDGPPGTGQRVFLRFEGVMTGAGLRLNGQPLEEHRGGFLPFEREITALVRARNDLEVAVDGRWQNVPPGGTPKGSRQIDYLMPAGIHRDVTLRVLPELFLDDVFARPVDLLGPERRLEIECAVDAARAGRAPVSIDARLLEGESPVAAAGAPARVGVAGPGRTVVHLTMRGLEGVGLWSPDSPRLYTLELTLAEPGGARHRYRTRIGLREARFAVDGFYLNGRRTRIFGLNRHELFPYAGFAMPERVMRHDAALLRHRYNLNTVRCSHYPQTEAFLDACDELGLMVWEEVPGWQYIGDGAWQELLLGDLRTMILRDRNHPSIILWGARVNESRSDVGLYTRTTALARSLDDSRQISGTMTRHSTEDWVEDVFAYDDYHAAPDGSVAMSGALPEVPYLFAEAVGQFAYEHGGGFKQYYRRAGAREVQEAQARYHAQGHDRGAADPRSAGVIAWCAIDYASQMNGYRALKCPGVTDTFRIPKLGAAFYLSQVSPAVRPVIEPGFSWDFSGGAGPGSRAMIFSNCDRLVVTAGVRPPVTVDPDRAGYPNLSYPPFEVDLSAPDHGGEDLVVEGLVAGRPVLRRRFSSDRTRDRLTLACDDPSIRGDGGDATRVWFAVCDRYGAIVPHLEGTVAVTMEGPGELVGDTSFRLEETGGVGAVWVRSPASGGGELTVAVEHPRFGRQKVSVHVERAG